MIYVDADACPVKPEVETVATRRKVPVKMVSNGGIRPSANPLIESVFVAEGPDEADKWIAEQAGPGDVVVTNDIPLAAKCVEAGIDRDLIIADPGIGFGKTFEHNLQLLDGLAMFHGLGVPLMLGVSRKAFIGAVTGVEKAGDRVTGSVAAALAGLDRGVQIFRVHDVAETAQAFKIWSAVRQQTV